MQDQLDHSQSRFCQLNWLDLSLKWLEIDSKSTCWQWSDLTWLNRNTTNFRLESDSTLHNLWLYVHKDVRVLNIWILVLSIEVSEFVG